MRAMLKFGLIAGYGEGRKHACSGLFYICRAISVPFPGSSLDGRN